jgi:hypothetical protein
MNHVYHEEITTYLGNPGKMISSSKSGYRQENPTSLTLFNANVCFLVEEAGPKILGIFKTRKIKAEKVWHGDLDITKSRIDLKNLAACTGNSIVVLHEMDARFDNAKDPMWKNYVYRVDPDGSELIGGDYMDLIIFTDDMLELLPQESYSEKN